MLIEILWLNVTHVTVLMLTELIIMHTGASKYIHTYMCILYTTSFVFWHVTSKHHLLLAICQFTQQFSGKTSCLSSNNWGKDRIYTTHETGISKIISPKQEKLGGERRIQNEFVVGQNYDDNRIFLRGDIQMMMATSHTCCQETSTTIFWGYDSMREY